MLLLNTCLGVLCAGLSAMRPITITGALPPGLQLENDLRDLSEFIELHHEISSTLKMINVRDYTITFGSSGECTAYFDRVHTHPLGPPGRLVFVKSNCDFILKNKSLVLPKGINLWK